MFRANLNFLSRAGGSPPPLLATRLNILKLSYKSVAFTSYKSLLKNKKWSGTSPPALFSALFLSKHVSLIILY